jgi:hypothetical protein
MQVEDGVIKIFVRDCVQEETFLTEVAGPETPQGARATIDIERQASCPALAATTVHNNFS